MNENNENTQDDFLDNADEGFFKTFYRALFSTRPMQVVAWLVIINTGIFIAMAFNGAGIFESDTEVVIKWAPPQRTG